MPINIVKPAEELGYRAKQDRHAISGKVVNIDSLNNTATIDTGFQDQNGNPVYLYNKGFSPQAPPQLGDMVQLGYSIPGDPHSSYIGQMAVGASQTIPGGSNGTQVVSNGGVWRLYADSNPELLGLIQLISGTGVNLTQVGQTITFSATAGPWLQDVVTLSGPYTIATPASPTAYFFSNAAPQTVTLPAASLSHVPLVIWKDDANTNLITLAGAGGDTINGGSTYGNLNAQYTGFFLMSDGVSKWYVIPVIQTDPIFGASGSSHAPGDVPDPGSTSGITRFLREDATWAVPADVVFGASGSSHSAGDVPDPGAVAGTTHFLREDATWAVPSAATNNINFDHNGSLISTESTLNFEDGATNQTIWTVLDNAGSSRCDVSLEVVLQPMIVGVSSKTANYTVATGDCYLPFDTTSGALTCTFPAANSLTADSVYFIKNIGSHALTVSMGSNADGSSSFTLNKYDVLCVCNASISRYDVLFLHRDVTINGVKGIVVLDAPPLTWTFPNTQQELAGAYNYRNQADLTNCTQARIVASSPNLPPGDTTFEAQYSTNGGSSWSSLAATGAVLCTLNGSVTGQTVVGSWTAIATGANADVLLRFTAASQGGPSSFTTGYVSLEVR